MYKKIIALVVVAGIVVFAAVALFDDEASPAPEQPSDSVLSAFELLAGSLSSSETSYIDCERTPAPSGGAVCEPSTDKPLSYREAAEYNLTLDSAGWYALALDYRPTSSTLSDFCVSVKINGLQQYSEMSAVTLPLIWRDETKDFPLDSYGDQVAPAQIRQDDFAHTMLYSNIRASLEPLMFYFEQGDNAVLIENVSNDGLLLGELTASAPEFAPGYAEYIQAYANAPKGGEIYVNATSYETKNSTQVILKSENNASLTPNDVSYKKLNTLSFTDAGSEAVYRVDAPSDGLYSLSLHYKSSRQDLDTFVSVAIDGETPFNEALCLRLPDTASVWRNITFGEGGEPYLIYLSKGEHTVSIRLEMQPVMLAFRYARLLSEHVTRLTLNITKVAGKQADTYRTWKMTRYIPEIPAYLDAYRTLIAQTRYLLSGFSEKGGSAALLSELDKALMFIDQVSEYPDEIALYVDSLTGRDNSVLVSLSTFTTALVQNNLTLDMLYLSGSSELPDESAGFAGNVGNWFSTLGSSFTTDKYTLASKQDDGSLTIWVNRALTHVDTLQKLVDTGFTAETGIRVKLSAMPDASKLTLSAAAGDTPDIALGLPSYMPFDLACRGALCDMTEFDDFWLTCDRFSDGALVPYVFNEGVYALPETMDFNALIYRTDIFENLGLSVPDTWDDVTDMLPQLQRFGMNFYHNISYGVGYKWFYQTTPLIYQNGGSLYTEDGLRTAIDKPNAVRGLQALGNLYIAYSLDKQVNSFFNYFRYSVLPIGVVDANDYILIKNGAPELEGRWALAPLPGTADESGKIMRWYVSNGQGGVIFDDSTHKDEAWEFIKWWTRHDTQSTYASTLLATYGKAYLWLSANLDALADAPVGRADKDVILSMASWLRDVPRSPGQYLLERSISDIWVAMINNGVSAQVAADEKVVAINREIRKKLQELGYVDELGNLLKPYVVRDVDWITEQINTAREANANEQ